MARNKTLARKIRYGKAQKRSDNIPTWVVMKTKGKVRYNPYSRRHWRGQRLNK